MTNLYVFGGRHFWDRSFHCCFPTVKFLADGETHVHHIPSSRHQQIQLEAEKKRWFSKQRPGFLCGFGTATSQKIFKLQRFTEQRYLGRRCFPGEAAPRSLWTLLPENYPSSIVEKLKRTERSCSWCKVWSGHPRPLEPAGAGAGRVSPILFGLCLLCVVTWTCSSVFMEDFPENLFQGLPAGHSDAQGHLVWLCLAPSKWESFWLCPFTPQTQEKWGPAYLSTNLCPVLSNKEEKKTSLSSVNCFFVTGYTSKAL